MEPNVEIAPADGRLGVLTPGMGAVATTFFAGVHAVLKGLGPPVGSLTQMGTIRLGKRTEKRVPMIRDFVPLNSLDSLVFGGWDIFEENMYEAACHARVLDPGLLETIRPELEAITPMTLVTAPPEISLRTALEIRHRSQAPVLLTEDGQLIGVIGEDEIFAGILRQARPS